MKAYEDMEMIGQGRAARDIYSKIGAGEGRAGEEKRRI